MTTGGLTNMYHRLKTLRKTLQMNQSDFAKRLGLSQSTLAMLELGKRNFNEKHLKLVCSAFGVREQWMRAGEGDMFAASPYEGEVLSLFGELRPEAQRYLLTMARELVEAQNSLLESPSTQKDN